MNRDDMLKWGWLGILFLLAIGAFSFYYFSGYEFSLSAVQRQADYLYQLVQNKYVLSIILFCLIFIAATVCFIPVTVLLSVVAGFLFGVMPGTLLAVFSATAGSCIIFLIMRNTVGKKIQKKYATKLTMFNRDLEKYGAYYLLALQLLPVTPTFIINLGAGLSSISLRTFFWTTALGLLPGTLVYSFAGQKLHSINSLNDLLSAPILLALVGLAVLVLLMRVVKSFYDRPIP
ncbi:TVP38/TMEM64 family protein [Candidatus Dependentiae bacterium]|nr:TVP38/TMEM64 family protein [Candidatus Dependentiae bacterium]